MKPPDCPETGQAAAPQAGLRLRAEFGAVGRRAEGTACPLAPAVPLLLGTAWE